MGFGVFVVVACTSFNSFFKQKDAEAGEESDSSDEEDINLRERLSSLVGSREPSRTEEERAEADVKEFLADRYTSRKILAKVILNLSEIWSVLILMYWSLMNNRDDLMDCETYSPGFISHFCEYTDACLSGFPHLASNVTLAMTIRALIQLRIYYTMLTMGYVMDFADNHILKSVWPWACMVSIGQGGLHLLVKAWLERSNGLFDVDGYMRLFRKFVLPGSIFMGFFIRYAEIENVLIPLNRIVERDYTEKNRRCPYLGEIRAMDERVVAFDARHRDIVGEVMKKKGAKPTLKDIVEDIIQNYDRANRHYKKHKDRLDHAWGLFKSLWPAAVLVDERLDRKDPYTWEWLLVFGLTCSLCLMATFISLIYFFLVTFDRVHELRSERFLKRVVMMFHGLIVFYFIYRTIYGMFYLKLHHYVHKVTVDTSAFGPIAMELQPPIQVERWRFFGRRASRPQS